MERPPAVSVVVPTYEAPDYLVQTVEAILSQRFRDLELLVVDDGSGPATRAALEPYGAPLRYIRKENGGPASAKNAGVAAARGELVAFCDHDDLWRPEKLERHVARHRAEPALGLTFSQVIPFREDGSVKPRTPAHGVDGDAFLALVRKSLIPTSSAVVCRRDLLARAGPLDEAFRVADDYEYWFRLARLAPFGFIPEPLVAYRLHGSNASRNRARLHEEKAAIFERLEAEASRLPVPVRRAIRAKRAHHLVALARCRAKEGSLSEARALLREAARAAPLSPKVRRHQLLLWLRSRFAR